jgi:hypothetical protein
MTTMTTHTMITLATITPMAKPATTPRTKHRRATTIITMTM